VLEVPSAGLSKIIVTMGALSDFLEKNVFKFINLLRPTKLVATGYIPSVLDGQVEVCVFFVG
jgi:hypothetical protein